MNERTPTPNAQASNHGFEKAPSGIQGLDEITGGGLPVGQTTLVCGGAGCGKTLLGTTFLVHGATACNEPGVLISFEERPQHISRNVASLGQNLDELVADKRLALDFIEIDRNGLEPAGEFDLEGLFIRLGYAIDQVGARRVVLDTIDVLFAGFTDAMLVRSELRRLFGWLKDRGVTTLVTAERGRDDAFSRHGVEEFVSDCVILLDNRIYDQISTRRLRVVKYRGSAHGTNEYPFLIEAQGGITVFPISATELDHEVSNERVSTGVDALNLMLGGEGFYRGSTILVSGAAGSGKTSLAAKFLEAACERGEQCVYFAFEESPLQIVRNMRSIGINLQPWMDKGLLRFSAARPDLRGLETHLAVMLRTLDLVKPTCVVVDPMTGLTSVGSGSEVHAMLLRLVDTLKAAGITAVLTGLESAPSESHPTQTAISSLIDTWLLLRNVEAEGEHNRVLHVRKSRGMPHSNQIREFHLTDSGPQLMEPYIGPEGVLTGSARLMQEARDTAAALLRKQELERIERELQRKRAIARAHIQALEAQLEADEAEARLAREQARTREVQVQSDRAAMAASRRSLQPERDRAQETGNVARA